MSNDNETPTPAKQVNEEKEILLTDHMTKLYASWKKTHPGQPAPLLVDRNGQARWQNRHERRARAKLDRKKSGK